MTGHWNYYRLSLTVLALAVFLAATLSRVSIPMAEWDHVILSAAADWAQGVHHEWLFDHPPLYPACLALVFRAFGAGADVARTVNIACVLVTALCLYRWSAIVFNSKAAFWALVVFLAHPFPIQGVSSMDMADTSMLPLLFLWTAAALRSLVLRPTAGRAGCLGACLAMCMWAKLSATIAWMTALGAGFGVAWLVGERREMLHHGIGLAAGCFLGIGIYLVTSFVILNGLWGSEAFLFPWRAAYAAVMDRGELDGAAGALSMLYSLFKIVVWLSPYLLLIFCLAFRDALKEYARSSSSGNRFLIWIGTAAAAYGLAHILIGGANYGFPRYHAPIFPIMCMLSGSFISASMPVGGRRGRLALGIATAASVILSAMLAPDPLLFLNIRLKEMLLRPEGFLYLIGQALAAFLPMYGLSLLAALGVLRTQAPARPKTVWAVVCILGLLATVVSQDLQHAMAPYRTTVQYGASGKEELVKAVRAHLSPGDRVLAAPEFIYELRDLNVPRVGWKDLRSFERFHRFVRQYEPAAIIGGLTVSSLGHLKWMLSEETCRFLSERYRAHRVGTYYLWLREDADRARDFEISRKEQ
jgi:hypothetical protein